MPSSDETSSDESTHATNDKLVYMANQIGAFFKSQDLDTAPARTADHIIKFWDPRMRREIIAYIDAGGGRHLDPVARQAIEALRPKS
ncbi:MAG TPA: formate dehydrogenase subunit delta [Stellaceae bacterium]|nr:formate dehydrogenase subunit delta [Stellaceae bacterium]